MTHSIPNHTTQLHRSSFAGIRTLSSALALTLAVAVLPAAPAQAQEHQRATSPHQEQAPEDPKRPDGSSPSRAAASCWEIKTITPTAESGTYWLYTPQMSEPAEFYCDQETDGGGWVMVGRGRENWKETYAGQGTPQQIASTPAGPEAFRTAQLPSTTIDALLNGTAPHDLQDGIRLRRALNVQGTDWQEVRFARQNSPRWSWAFRSDTPVASQSFTNPGARQRCPWWQLFTCQRSQYEENWVESGTPLIFRGSQPLSTPRMAQ